MAIFEFEFDPESEEDIFKLHAAVEKAKSEILAERKRIRDQRALDTWLAERGETWVIELRSLVRDSNGEVGWVLSNLNAFKSADCESLVTFMRGMTLDRDSLDVPHTREWCEQRFRECYRQRPYENYSAYRIRDKASGEIIRATEFQETR